MAKWQGAVFQFVGYDEVWLHCDIKVCFNDADCLPSCGALGIEFEITSDTLSESVGSNPTGHSNLCMCLF